MKESAHTAFAYIRANAEKLGIDERIFEENEIHLHIPAGAIPKDGPSAGITLTTAIISLLTDTKICGNVAMTGEMTLTGKVLPIGGIKDKALAAMRAGIETVIFPNKNEKDLLDIPEEYRNKISFIPAQTIDEVLKVAILDWDEHLKKIEEMKKKKAKKGNLTKVKRTESMAA